MNKKIISGASVCKFFRNCIVVTLFAASAVIWGNERANQQIEVHFQKLLFNIPQDEFYVGSFDQRTGEINWDREYNQPPATGFAQKVGEHYSVVIQRANNTESSYDSKLVDLSSKEILLDLGIVGSWGVFKNDFYFAHAWELRQFSFASKRVTVVEKRVTAVAASDDQLVTFTVEGKIFGSGTDTNTKQLLASFDGVVTNAGFLTNHWVWYFLRGNEKSDGNLWLLNLDTREQHKIDKKLPQCRLVNTSVHD